VKAEKELKVWTKNDLILQTLLAGKYSHEFHGFVYFHSYTHTELSQ
jgi:hypothetical protein